MKKILVVLLAAAACFCAPAQTTHSFTKDSTYERTSDTTLLFSYTLVKVDLGPQGQNGLSQSSREEINLSRVITFDKTLPEDLVKKAFLEGTAQFDFQDYVLSPSGIFGATGFTTRNYRLATFENGDGSVTAGTSFLQEAIPMTYYGTCAFGITLLIVCIFVSLKATKPKDRSFPNEEMAIVNAIASLLSLFASASTFSEYGALTLQPYLGHHSLLYGILWIVVIALTTVCLASQHSQSFRTICTVPNRTGGIWLLCLTLTQLAIVTRSLPILTAWILLGIGGRLLKLAIVRFGPLLAQRKTDAIA